MKSQVTDRRLKEMISEVPFEGEIRFTEPMVNHTSLRIGGPADIVAIPRDIVSLRNMLVYLKRKEIPFFPLGGGTNILVKDGGIEGVVVTLMSFKGIKVLSEKDTSVNVYVEAGTPLQVLVNFAKDRGFAGLEGLVGIPGSFGGAVCGNAGAFGYEIKDVVLSVSIIDAEGRIKTTRAEDLEFGYRRSNISKMELLLAAEIRLRKNRKEDISVRMRDFIQRKKKTQPISESSAGCVFKNSPGLSAGKMIEEAGCKGMRIGDIEVSNIHANFFINKGGARASDFIRLMDKVAQRVKERFGIFLEPEIKIVGRDVC